MCVWGGGGESKHSYFKEVVVLIQNYMIDLDPWNQHSSMANRDNGGLWYICGKLIHIF